MSNAERWLEISEVMTFEVHAVVEAAAEQTSRVEAEITATEIEERPVTEEAVESADTETAETIEMPEQRSARVLSISELRQRLGIEAPVARSSPPPSGRPRIVRRRENEAYHELAAG